MGDRQFKAKGHNIDFVGILNGNTKNMIRRDYQDNDRISAEEIIRELEEEAKNEDFRLPDFSGIKFSPEISFIVDEITNSYRCDRGLVLLALLASVAGLDRGKHIIQVDSLGLKNTLSTLILGGAESGEGKSRIIDTFVDIIDKIKPKQTKEELVDQNLRSSRLKYLNKQYSKTGDDTLKCEIYRITQEIENGRPEVLLVSDITREALIDKIAKQGFIFRMESEKAQHKENTYDIIRKLWSNEGHSKERVTRESNCYSGGLIVSLVYTQLEPFYSYIQEKRYWQTGLIARTLCYRANSKDKFSFATPERAISTECKEKIENLLKRIFCASAKRDEQAIVHFAPEAEQEWYKIKNFYSELAKKNEVEEIATWVKRAAEHILRIAGIIHLIEHENPDDKLISLQELMIAAEIVVILLNNLLQALTGYGDSKQIKCTCQVGIYILKENQSIYNETEIKQRFKDKYNANEVDIALYYLERRRIIKEKLLHLSGKSRGRPKGKDYYNLYYERHY